jgi:hypothetical protein
VELEVPDEGSCLRNDNDEASTGNGEADSWGIYIIVGLGVKLWVQDERCDILIWLMMQ